MSCRTVYRFLRQDQRSFLCDAAHTAEREIFLDCLAALHDLALATGSFGGGPAFTNREVESVFSRTSHWSPPPLSGLRQNIEINWEAVDDLRALTGEVGAESHTSDFADAVIREYQLLRTTERSATATSPLSF